MGRGKETIIMKKTSRLAFLLAAVVVCGLLFPAPSLAAVTLKTGSEGGDVWDLQYRLQTLGLYTLPLDGKFGYATEQAVRQYQRKYGLTVDGAVGPRTWASLKKFTLNKSEMDMMARIIYSEARGESYTGQVAVGAVVMNRIRSPLFPDNIADVIFQAGAFTAVDDGQYWLKPNKTAYLAAWDAVRGWDPTGGAFYYFNPDTATSAWIWTRKQTVKIGNHIFAK
jgi:N-acetylmuramoyl-L-alanine amidase